MARNRGEKIEELLHRRNKSKSWLAAQLGKPKQSLQQWLKGSEPRDPEVWPRVAAILDVDFTILDDDNKSLPSRPDEVVVKRDQDLDPNERLFVDEEMVLLPVWRGVIAGMQDECVFYDSESPEVVEVPRLFVGKDAAKCIVCMPAGPSMLPRIRQGDRVIVRQDPLPPRNTLVVAENPERRRFIKALREKSGYELHSLNSKFPPITDVDGWSFYGSVVAIWSPYDESAPNIEWNAGRPLRA